MSSPHPFCFSTPLYVFKDRLSTHIMPSIWRGQGLPALVLLHPCAMVWAVVPRKAPQEIAIFNPVSTGLRSTTNSPAPPAAPAAGCAQIVFALKKTQRCKPVFLSYFHKKTASYETAFVR